MTDLPDPAPPSAPAEPQPGPAGLVAGDPELAALVRATANAPTEPAPTGGAAPAAGVPDAPTLAQAAVSSPTGVVARPVAAPRHRGLALRFAFSFLVGVLLVVGVGGGALFAWGQQYDGRILPGVRVGTMDLSGLTREQAQAAIASAYASLGAGKIVLNDPAGQVTITYAEIARGPDTAAILNAALAAGRQGEPLADLIGAPQAALRGVTVPTAVTYDRAKLAAAVDALDATIDQPAVDASVVAAPDGTYSVVPATTGRTVDKAALLTSLDQQLTALGTPASITLDVPVVSVAPVVQTAAADAAQAAASRMAADLVIARGTDTWTIPSAQLGPLISITPAADGTLTPSLDASGLDPLLATLAKQVNQTAQDATLKLVGNHVVASGTSREGRTLDVAAMKAAIVAQLAARQAGTAVEPLAATVKAVQPKLSSAVAQQYASEMAVVGQHTTWFPVWIGNGYGANIWVPTALLNGYVVGPGQTFDFWKVLGTPTAAQGYKPGNAIIDGRTSITGAFAGGICSTSTTLFNAALEAGLKMEARANHYYYISRYPTGLDATVWISGGAQQTMSFTNDTPYPVLIQGVNTRSGGTGYTTFKIWSVPNGRIVTIGPAIVKNYHTAADTTVYTATLPKGAKNRVQDPEDGFDVWRTVTVKDASGAVRWSKTYYSHYATVTGVLEVGTGGSQPGGGTTPSPTPSPSPSPSPSQAP